MEYEFSVSIDEFRTLLLTEISRRTFEEQAIFDLEDDHGLFLVLEDTQAGTFEILAKVASSTAGRNLIQMMTRASSGPTLVSI